MNMSESIKELSSALAKAQAEMANPKKNSSNPFFKSKYADLSEVINVSKPVLASHGLSILQLPGYQDGLVSVETVITHESGEYISSIMSLPPVKGDPQAVGSAVTYARRYALAAICGIAQEDDDGNEAVKQVAPKKRVNKKQVQGYVADFIVAIENEDALAIRQMGEELTDTPEHDAVWQALDSEQKTKVKAILQTLRETG
jgi:hypothetical protein